jgi:hypothetical protein
MFIFFFATILFQLVFYFVNLKFLVLFLLIFFLLFPKVIFNYF